MQVRCAVCVLLHRTISSDVMALYCLRLQFVFLSFVVVTAATSGQPTRPNIVFILADDLGWNDVSLHGSNQIPTPHIDRLASEGVILNNYYTMHLCSPTRGALLTGRHPMQLGLQRFVITETTPFGLGLNETILPQYLKKFGYSTHLVGKWHQGFFAKELTPLYRGFDTFYGFLASHGSYYDHRCNCEAVTGGYGAKDGYDLRDGLDVDFRDNNTYSTYLFTDRAERIIRQHDQRKPMFLYLAQQAVHSGFGSSNPAVKRQELEAPQHIIDKFSYIKHEGRRRFAAMTYLLDESVGNVTRALKESGMLDNTIIAFATDNGGPPHGLSFNYASNWPLRGAKASYWQGGVRGVALLWSRLLKQPSTIYNGMMHVTDWLPTLLHAASGKPTEIDNLYGKDMWNSLISGGASARSELVVNWDKATGAYIKGDYKLVVLGDDDMVVDRSDWYLPEDVDVNKVNFTVKCQRLNSTLPECTRKTSPCLYNLNSDPCEYYNLAGVFPELVKELMNELMSFAGQAQPPRNCPNYKGSFPEYHNGTWTPYITLNDTEHDRMC